MNKLVTYFGTCLLTIVFTSGVAMAADALSKEEAEKLIAGNTAEGVVVKAQRKMIWYFAEDGTIHKLLPTGEKKKTKDTWNIDKKGNLCYQDKWMQQPNCGPISRRADGKYDAIDGRWLFDKVLPGNPHDL
jgi:hypothetical protein